MYLLLFHICVQLEIWPVDDISESVFAVGWVNGRTGVAGNEVGGIMEQVDIDQVQTSARNTHKQTHTHTHTHTHRGEIRWYCMWQVEIRNRKQSDNAKAWHLIGECVCEWVSEWVCTRVSLRRSFLINECTCFNAESTNKHICLLCRALTPFLWLSLENN